MKNTCPMRSATVTFLMAVTLCAHHFSVDAWSETLKTPNPEFTAFLMASALGTKSLSPPAIGPDSPELNKSPNRAFLSSLIVPGTGQLYVGAKRGYFYAAAGVALMVSYFITYRAAETTRNDYRELVRRHVIFDGPGTFETWDPIEDFEHATMYDNWHNIYTEQGGQPLVRVGRWYWNDRAVFKDEDRGSKHDSPNREEAQGLRELANHKFEGARKLIGVALFNHVISAVEARIAAKNYNKKSMDRFRGFNQVKLDLQTTVEAGSVDSRFVLRGQF